MVANSSAKTGFRDEVYMGVWLSSSTPIAKSSREGVSPNSELPLTSEQPSAVAHCIYQLERRCCLGDPGSVPAYDESSTIRSGFILPSILSSTQTRTTLSGITLSADCHTVVPDSLTTLKTWYGCWADSLATSHCGGTSHFVGGGCNGNDFFL